MTDSASRAPPANRRILRVAIAVCIVVGSVVGVGSPAIQAVDFPLPSPHLNACFPEPALPVAPYLGPAVDDALTYDDWLATVIATVQGCDELREPLFGELRLPLADPIVSSHFGERFHPMRRRWLPHAGVDLVDSSRQWRAPVFAAGPGTLVATGSFQAYGRSIIIDHGDRVATVYTHLSSVAVRDTDLVESGEQIGRVGATGSATGPHLHFELRLGGAAVNPLDYTAPWLHPPNGHP